MTRQHFQLIAETIAGERERTFGLTDEQLGFADGVLDGLAYEFAHRLAETNPNFDQERFLKAAGVGR